MGERRFCDGCGSDTGVVRHGKYSPLRGTQRTLKMSFENHGSVGEGELMMDLCGQCYARALAFIESFPDMMRRWPDWWDSMKGGSPDGTGSRPATAEVDMPRPFFVDPVVAAISDDDAWANGVSAAEAARCARELAREVREWRRWSHGHSSSTMAERRAEVPGPAPAERAEFVPLSLALVDVIASGQASYRAAPDDVLLHARTLAMEVGEWRRGVRVLAGPGRKLHINRAPIPGEKAAPDDWTAKDGRSNSSDEFLELGRFVGDIIRNSADTLMSGQSHTVGGLIMAQLAHAKGLAPRGK